MMINVVGSVVFCIVIWGLIVYVTITNKKRCPSCGSKNIKQEQEEPYNWICVYCGKYFNVKRS